nr:ribonuclease HII [Candidatus Solincola tengchongensis]
MGFRRVAGVDEAGRGALAGPLVAAAVILPRRVDLGILEGLADSKAISPAHRRRLFPRILEVAEAWSFACAPPWEIDAHGLQEANLAAMREAVQALHPPPDLVLVDFYALTGLGHPQWCLVHGDTRSASVAAASVVAKVIRDSLMLTWWTMYPEYGFDSHKGYGTPGHLRRIAEKGPAPCHRSSFRGVVQTRMDLE